MSYHVLARKWRPQTFADLVGQNHVVKALTYALSHNQIHHAYLFTGTRGVGKTSIARIFAKSLNCETNGISANPCGQCESCQEIKSGKFIDLIEVDAASRTGVDETRELIDSVAYRPHKGRYKVYLIDEVHMFSKSSFNALLKTLEEPPEYVKFILATTDPEKLPITILSRCLQFNLKSLTQSQIRQHLQNICEAESVAYDSAALALLAGAGDGSMRDTLSMTDQAIAYGHGELSLSAVTEILGTIQPADIEAILFAIATNNPTQLNTALQRLDNYEVDARAFLIEIMRRLQRMSWAKEGIVDDLSPALQSTVIDIPKPLLHLWYDIAQKALPNLAIAGEPREAVEMTLLRMLAFIPDGWVVRHRTLLDNNEIPKTNSSSNDLPEVTPPSITKEQVANNDFAAKVQAAPVIQHDSLAAAEAEFSSEIPTDPPTNTETAPDDILDADDTLVSDAALETVIQSESPTTTAVTQAQDWHLSAQTDEAPTPSMDEIRAMMQRGSDLKRPIDNSNTDNSGINNVDKNDLTTTTQTAHHGTPPWDDTATPTADSTRNTLVEPKLITNAKSHYPKTQESPKKSSTQAIQKSLSHTPPLAIDVKQFDWFSIINKLGLSEYTHHFASLGILHLNFHSENSDLLQATLDLPPKNEVMITDDSVHELNDALQNHFDAPIQLAVNLTEISETTPAQRAKHANEQQQADLLTQFTDEPLTAKFRQALQAEVLPDTVKTRNT